MKKLLTILFIILLVAVILPKLAVVQATVEAQATAQLVVNTVSQDSRVAQLEAYLASHNSPLAGEAEHFVAESDRLGLDWKLVAAIAGVESTFGRFIPTGSYNAWGWGVFTGAQDGVHFRDWQDGITQVSYGLRYNYLDRGAKTIEQIGRIYAASPAWSWKVRFFLNKIEEFVPNQSRLLDITI